MKQMYELARNLQQEQIFFIHPNTIFLFSAQKCWNNQKAFQ